MGRVVLAAVLATLAFASQSVAAPTRASNFPSRGIVVPGKSIGGISLGMTQTQVLARWGRNYQLCDFCKPKSVIVWFYIYPGAEPLGAGVKMLNNKVVSVFTLGSPVGWGVKGVMMGDPVSNVYNLYGSLNSIHCIGFDALTVRIGDATFSFYSANGVIYGYALTAPSEKPCQ